MAIYETLGSLNNLVSNLLSMIRIGSLEGIVLLLFMLFIALMSLLYTVRIISTIKRGKSGLENVRAANNRKILLNMGHACTILDRLIHKTTDSGQLRNMKDRLSLLSFELLNKDNTNFSEKAASLDEWNTAEKALIDSSEKLALELERQLNSVLDITAIERATDAVGNTILNRVPLTPELNAIYYETSKKEKPEVKIHDAVSSELDHYLNSLLRKYANFSPEVLHAGYYPHEVKWEYSSGNKSITAALSNSRRISLVFETRWQESGVDLDELVQKEIASVNKNHYKCLCLVNRSWDRESREFARGFSYPKLALYLYELKGELYYNNKNASAEHYEFWFNTELKKETLNKLVVRYVNEHEFVSPVDLAKALGVNEKGTQSMLLDLEKKGMVIELSSKSDKIKKYAKSIKKV